MESASSVAQRRGALDGATECVNQSPVLVIIETSFTGGKYQDPCAPVSEYQKFHIAAKIRAEPVVVLASHYHYRTETLFQINVQSVKI